MFNELMSTPIDFTAFAMNPLQISDLTKADLVGPDYNLLKGTCKSYVELEYNMEESDYFFNNDLAYLQGGSIDKTYTTSLTKTKVAKYDLKGIEDIVPTLLSPIKVVHDKHALLGDFPRLHLNDIEDMLLHIVQNKLFNLKRDVIVDLAAALYPQGVIYEDMLNRKRLMRSDELYKFSDSTLQSVQDTLHDMATNLRMGYNKAMPRRRLSNLDKTQSYIMVKDIDR
ncbi:hypothetical protein Tco_1176811 [Tanacetum coccineum]